MRLFFAIWPPREAAEALHAWAMAAQRAAGGRVTRVETIHLTLAFLGEVDERLVPVLQDIPVTTARHSLPIEQARYWPHNRIVWVGPREAPGAMRLLFGNLAEKLLERGFNVENRPFAAHVTLLRKARTPQQLPQLPAVNWPVDEFVLVRSCLEAAGPRYEIVERFALT